MRELLKVNVGKSEPVEQALRRLLKKVQRAGVIAETKRRRAHESPRMRKIRRKAATVRKLRRRSGLSV